MSGPPRGVSVDARARAVRRAEQLDCNDAHANGSAVDEHGRSGAELRDVEEAMLAREGGLRNSGSVDRVEAGRQGKNLRGACQRVRRVAATVHQRADLFANVHMRTRAPTTTSTLETSRPGMSLCD